MEQKGCESIVTLNSDLTHDLDPVSAAPNTFSFSIPGLCEGTSKQMDLKEAV